MNECHHTTSGPDSTERSIVIETRTPKARKLHSCDECHRLINKGEEYRREILKWGSKFFHHKYCEDCLSLREVFFSNGWYYTYLWEDMNDFIGKVDGKISEFQITQLTKSARDKVCTLMQEMWDEEL